MYSLEFVLSNANSSRTLVLVIFWNLASKCQMEFLSLTVDEGRGLGKELSPEGIRGIDKTCQWSYNHCMNKVDVAWAAGFFDGEGHIAMNARCPILIVTQKDRLPLDRFLSIFGLGKITFYSRAFRYKVYGKNAVVVLSVLLPYLVVKRDRAISVLELRVHDLGEPISSTTSIKSLRVRELRRSGFTFAVIGQLLGVTRQRAHQLYYSN